MIEAGLTFVHFKRELMTDAEREASPLKYIYRVLCVAQHTETNEQLVIYNSCEDPSKIFARPYGMFCGEVDHGKYPTVKQKYRLELVQLPIDLKYLTPSWYSDYHELDKYKH